jgi:hypothetical protein
MLVINKEGIEALIDRLKFADEVEKYKAEIKQMLEIKEALLWRTEARSCCNIPWDLQDRLNWEIKLLQRAVEAIDVGNREKAVEMLQDIVIHLKDE